MNAKTFDVSVIIAAWNAQDTLSRAIESAVMQSCVTVEVIVVDDASTDQTFRIASEFAVRHPDVRVLQNPVNAGPATARNRALDAARAPYVALLDSDDAMAPGRLAGMLAIARDGDWDFVADDLYKVSDHDTKADQKRLWTDAEIGLKSLTFESFVRGNLSELHGNRSELGFIKPLMRRAFLNDNALRYREDMRLGEDYALYATALARKARFCLTDPLGYFALVRPESLSGKHSAADLEALVLADKFLAASETLSPSDRKLLIMHEIETQKRWRWLRLIEAVKARDVKDALGCFVARPSVVADLCAKLGEQVVLRASAAWRGQKLSPSSTGHKEQ